MSFSQMNLYFNWIYDHISNLIPSSVSTERLLRLVSLFDRINVAMTIRPNDQGLGNKISRVLSVFLSLHHGAPVKKLSLAALSALVLPRRRINSPIMVLLQVFFFPMPSFRYKEFTIVAIFCNSTLRLTIFAISQQECCEKSAENVPRTNLPLLGTTINVN